LKARKLFSAQDLRPISRTHEVALSADVFLGMFSLHNILFERRDTSRLFCALSSRDTESLHIEIRFSFNELKTPVKRVKMNRNHDKTACSE
jgi:hypothetical protein